MENDRAKRKAILLVVVVFLLGCAVGAMGMRVWAQRVYGRLMEAHGHRSHTEFVGEMTRELQLTSDQQKQLQSILDDTRKRYREIYEQVRPEYEATRQQARDRIRAMLTPEQLPKFEEFVRRIDEQRKKKESADRGER
jgi:Spy/CpxP family protein refolding chaperone